MKKFFMFLAVIGFTALSAQFAAAQETEAVEDTTATETAAAAPAVNDASQLFAGSGEEVPFHQALKTKFIEGGPGFMALIILCLILGLAVAIERILYLSLSKTNTKKLLAAIEEALKEGGIEKAKDVCRNKTVVSYGSVNMSLMENGLSWIALFIAIAPSLGFLGTVVGMIQAFDAIQAAGDISPNVVAGGMKVALITTVGGLIVAMILQVFYNYILAKIDDLTIDMEDSSISLVDILVKYENK